MNFGMTFVEIVDLGGGRNLNSTYKFELKIIQIELN
jgi:hypothetical protein